MAAAWGAPEAGIARWWPAVGVGPQELGALAERSGPAGIAVRLLPRRAGRLPSAATQEERAPAMQAKPPRVMQNRPNPTAGGMLRQAKSWGCAHDASQPGPHEMGCNSQRNPWNSPWPPVLKCSFRPAVRAVGERQSKVVSGKSRVAKKGKNAFDTVDSRQPGQIPRTDLRSMQGAKAVLDLPTRPSFRDQGRAHPRSVSTCLAATPSPCA